MLNFINFNNKKFMYIFFYLYNLYTPLKYKNKNYFYKNNITSFYDPNIIELKNSLNLATISISNS